MKLKQTLWVKTKILSSKAVIKNQQIGSTLTDAAIAISNIMQMVHVRLRNA